MKNLTLVKRAPFGSLLVDCYTDDCGNFYMTREQIGQALEYPHPRQSIDAIHRRRKKRLDPFSTVVKTATVDGKNREVVFYSSRGVYEICRHSNQPKADAFYDCVYEVLEGLRLGYLELQAHKTTPLWKAARASGIETRKAEGQTIKQFVEYARAQGSGHADRYYTSLSMLANKAAEVENRNQAYAGNLALLQIVERVIDAALIEGMAEGLPYKEIYQKCAQRAASVAALPGIKEGKQ